MKTFRWPCRVLSAYDGDTVTLDLDLGFSLTKRIACRLDGIDTPEMRRAAGIPDAEIAIFKRAGRLARDTLQAWIALGDAEFDWESRTLDKYGRSLGVLWPRGAPESGEASLNDRLVRGHLAVPYEGGARSGPGHIGLHRRNIEALIAAGRLVL